MQLKRVNIYNFRSIKEAEIEFSHNCLILLGKNEAGKSNILKAVAALFGEYTITAKDRRKKISNEVIKPEDYLISGEIELAKSDLEQIKAKAKDRYPGLEELLSSFIISLDFIIEEMFSEILIELDMYKMGLGVACYYPNNRVEELLSVTDFYITGNSVNIQAGNPFDVVESLFAIVEELLSENPIKCHYWRYSDNYILPSQVDINAFKTIPSKFPALENLFHLCGRRNIKEEFENALFEDGDYRNLLDQVSIKVTKTFQSIWQDMKGVSIQLIADGPLILIKIKEKVSYNCEDRSDGFKKFLSILLMLSTSHRSKKLGSNDIILIDEPDQSLYPTSARYLRDELLRISQSAKIIFSTHSQYMIDTDNLDRHLIVEKTGDITRVRKEDNNAPFATDELLKRAIGAGIFEVIKNKNIIFEGYHDKLLFEKYLGFEKITDQFANIGRVYLKGISGVDPVVSILDSANKKFIVISDSDITSKVKRKNFGEEHPDYKENWIAYSDQDTEIETLEDFLRKEYLESVIQKWRPEYEYNPKLKAIGNIERAAKDNKNDIKNYLFENCRKENIVPSYGELVNVMLAKIKGV